MKQHYKTNASILKVIATFCAPTSLIFGYFRGQSTYTYIYNFLDWIIYLLFALLVNQIVIFTASKNGRDTPLLLPYLPFILLASPLLYTIETLVHFPSFNAALIITILTQTLQILSFSSVLWVLARSKSIHQPIPAGDAMASPTEVIVTKTVLDRLIDNISGRVNSTARTISLSLTLMILLALIGGGASIGTVALNEAGKVRQLEQERQKLLKLTKSITADNYISPGLRDSTNRYYSDTKQYIDERISEVKKLIAEGYGSEDSYKNMLEKIEKDAVVSWPDITMRVAIAALTLFLVQIIFQIYKYNQQQAAYLMNKVEILELFRVPGSDTDELRTELLSKLNEGARFEKGPNSPTEQAIAFLGKAKEGK